MSFYINSGYTPHISSYELICAILTLKFIKQKVSEMEKLLEKQ